MEKLESGDGTRERLSIEQRLERFAEATLRQGVRDSQDRSWKGNADRGWTRDDLYDRC